MIDFNCQGYSNGERAQKAFGLLLFDNLAPESRVFRIRIANKGNLLASDQASGFSNFQTPPPSVRR